MPTPSRRPKRTAPAAAPRAKPSSPKRASRKAPAPAAPKKPRKAPTRPAAKPPAARPKRAARKAPKARTRRNTAPVKRAPRRPAEQPRSLLDFQQMFSTEAACADYLERVRWPDGFVCGTCGAAGEPYRFTATPELLQCRACRHKVSLTSGTVMHRTKQPLQVWFWAAYLVSTQTPGMSALQFQRQLGFTRYETAFQLFHKLRAGMVRPERDTIGGEWPVEVDEAFVGGKTKGKGRGVTDAPLVVAAVEVRERVSPKKGRRQVYAGRLRLKQIVSRAQEELEPFVRENITPGTMVLTDGWDGYNNLVKMGYGHAPMVVDGDHSITEAHLPLIHIVFSNLKTWLRGTHHGVSPQHLQAYLNEYAFRFNRRFYPMTSFASVLGIGTVSAGPTYEGLYGGEWTHPNPPDELMARIAGEPRRKPRKGRWVNRRPG